VSAGEKTSTLRLIAVFKLVKGGLLAIVALKVLRLVHEDLELAAFDLASKVHLDPDGRLVEPILRRLLEVDPRALTRMSFGALSYAGLLITEGVGLVRGAHWAEWLTVVATSSLVPLELYELYRRVTAPRLLALAVNLAIVGYLIVLLRRQRSARRASASRHGLSAS